MIKSLLVLAALIVACNAYAEDDIKDAKCIGFAAVLKLPDENVFGAFMALELSRVKEKYGNNSNEYSELFAKNTAALAWGKGFLEGYLSGPNTDSATAMGMFMGYCWKNDYELRKETLARLAFLNK